MERSIRTRITALLAALIVLLPTGAVARPRSHAKSLTIREIAKRCLPSIASLTVLDDNGAPAVQGSAFVIGPNLIATNVHVIAWAHSVTANFQNGRSEAVYGVVNYDIDRDICILYANTSGIPALPLGSLHGVQVGDPVVALGCPEGLGPSISTGIVSGIRVKDGAKIVQTTAPISHGSSGGALVDGQGRVLGITSFFVDDGQNLNFAYASWYLSQLLPRGIVTYLSWNELELQYAKDHPATSSKPASTSATQASALKSDNADVRDITGKPLAGLRGVSVTVEDNENILSKAGLDINKLHTDVVNRLRKAGIKVFDSDSDPENPSDAVFILGLQAEKNTAGNYGLLAFCSVLEDVDFRRGAPSHGLGGSWVRTIVQSTSRDDLVDKARSAVLQGADIFIKEYKDDNPTNGK